MSDAVPPPAARPLERAARVPRPVCPGCGRCGRVNPAPVPKRAPLRAGVARCGSGGRASPGGVPPIIVRGAWCQALSLPWPPVLWSGQPGFRNPCVPGAVDAGVWMQHRPHSVRPCGPALLAVGVAEGRPRGGVPSTIVRGAWCQALSLPRPPVLWSGQPGFRDPCVPGAVDAGVGTQNLPHSVRPCGPALLAVGVAEGRPRGGAFHRCAGRLVSGAVPPPAACPLERAARVPRPVCPGCGRCGRVDPAPAPQRAPLRAGVARCGGGGRASPGGGAFHRCEGRLVSGAVPPPAARPLERAARVPRPACPGRCRCGRGDPAPAPQRAPLRAGVARCGGGGRAAPGRGVFHRCEGRLGSGAVPLPAARPLERAARVPRPACPGRGRCGRGDPAPAPQRAPLRAGVARCGGGGRASPGGVPSTIVRGAWGQALSLSRLPAHCWVGCRGSLGVCGVCGVCAVRVVVRGAALPLVLRCSPLWCLGAVLCSPCARRVPSPVRAPCSSAGYSLFLSRLCCSLPFPLPFSLACTFFLPPLCCVSLSLSLSARASSFEPA